MTQMSICKKGLKSSCDENNNYDGRDLLTMRQTRQSASGCCISNLAPGIGWKYTTYGAYEGQK